MKKIRPFSNGTDFMIWHNNNCADCNKYESESTDRNKAGCKYAFDIDISVIDGEISEKTANWIGYKNNALKDCKMKNITFKKVKINTEVFNQKTLF